jgi:heme exporter protein D
VTVLAALGFGLAWLAWSSDADARAVLVALAVCLLLAFGRTTFGSLVNLIPGSADLFFRRFMMGVQLAALLLAGRGAAWLATGAIRRLNTQVARWRPGLSAAVVLVAAVVVLAPAWLQLGAFDRRDGAAIAAQRRADATQGAQLDRLLAVINRDGGGRTYAGMRSNWGQEFTVGAVPVFKYLESRDVDEVGYTLRTASLMTDPEDYFDDRDPSDYRLFGIRYLILPAGSRPPVRARLELRAGPYSLWTLLGAAGVLDAGTIVGHLSANRTDIGTRTLPVLHSGLAQQERYEQVRFDQSASGVPARSSRSSTVPPPGRSAGTVVAQADRLTVGRAAATVAMRRRGVVVLSASFDPGWTATVDGRPQPTEMVAPALVATTVPAGTHRVVFRYAGFRGYALLFAISVVTLLALLCADVARARAAAPGQRRRRGRQRRLRRRRV